jgi:hypothetical protein
LLERRLGGLLKWRLRRLLKWRLRVIMVEILMEMIRYITVTWAMVPLSALKLKLAIFIINMMLYIPLDRLCAYAFSEESELD